MNSFYHIHLFIVKKGQEDNNNIKYNAHTANSNDVVLSISISTSIAFHADYSKK